MRSTRSLDPAALASAAAALGAVGLTAVAGWLVGAGHLSLVAAAALAVVGLAALLRWPAFTLVGLLVVCQELAPGTGFGGSSGLLFLGHQLYYTTVGRVSLLTIVALIAVARIVVTGPPRRLRTLGLWLVLAFGGLVVAELWVGGTSVRSAINQDARFAVLFGLCFVVGAWARRDAQWSAYALTVLRWLFTAMALLGLALAATGRGEVQSGINVIFYDSAMAAIAGAVVVAIVLAPAAARTPRIWWLGGAALIIVVLSSRRNVWAAMIVTLLIGLAFARDRGRLVLRLLVTLAILIVAVEVLAPGAAHELGHQISAIWGASQGNAADASTKGHIDDIAIGWRAITHSPWSGVGPNGQVPGLVVEGTGPLYIHNQLFESWLRFGLAGAALTVAAQLTLIGFALAFLRRSASDLSASWAAYLLIMAPISMVTAPFFTTTLRWPSILGFAAGLIAVRTVPTAVRSAPGAGAQARADEPDGDGPQPSRGEPGLGADRPADLAERA